MILPVNKIQSLLNVSSAAANAGITSVLLNLLLLIGGRRAH